jgi:hypothetical protein
MGATSSVMVVLVGDGSGQELSKDNANTRMSSGEFFGGFVLEVYDDGSDNFTLEAKKMMGLRGVPPVD